MTIHRFWLRTAFCVCLAIGIPWCATQLVAQQDSSRAFGQLARVTPHGYAALARNRDLGPQSSIRMLYPPADVKRTHWFEGGLVGAAALGVSVGLLVKAGCNRDSGTNCSTTVPTVIVGSAALGWVIGALVGGQIPKRERN